MNVKKYTGNTFWLVTFVPERCWYKESCEIFTTPKLVTAQESILISYKFAFGPRFDMKQKITGVTWIDGLQARGSFPTLSISKMREGDVWQGIARFVQTFKGFFGYAFDLTNIKRKCCLVTTPG